MQTHKVFDRQKLFTLLISFYHFSIATFLLIRGIATIQRLSNKLNGVLLTPSDYWLTAIFGILSLTLAITLFTLIMKWKTITIEQLQALTKKLMLQCIGGILFSFFYGGHLYFNENKKIIGGIILQMIIFEVFYLIYSSIFGSKTKKLTV